MFSEINKKNERQEVDAVAESKTDGKKVKKYWIFFGVLILINFFWFLGTTVSDMLIDSLISDLGGSYLETRNKIQYYDSMFQYTVAFSVIVFGLLVDRYPSRRKLFLLLVNSLWIIVNLVVFFNPIDDALYITMQIVWGLSMGAHGPIIFSYLGDLFEINYRGRLFSIFAIALYFIKGSSNILTGMIGSVMGSWKSPLLVMALGGIISLIILSAGIKDPRLAEIEPEFKDSIAKGREYSYRLDKETVKAIFKQRSNRLFIIQGFFGMFGVTIVNRYILYWLTSDPESGGLGMNTFTASYLLAAGAVFGALIGITLTGRLADKFFKQGRLDKMLLFPIISLFGEVLGYIVLLLIPSYPDSVDPEIKDLFALLHEYPVFWTFLIVFNICLMFGTAIGPVVGAVRTHINLPEQRASAAALYDTADFIGAAFALILGALISTQTGSLRLTIVYGALFWLISAILWLFIRKYINEDYAEIRKIIAERAKEIL